MIGCGRISQLAMQKCKYGFGMNVIGYDPYLKMCIRDRLWSAPVDGN